MPPQTLRIHSPTPSTTSYTVTTGTLPRSRLARLAHRLFLLLRVLLAATCAGALAVVVADYMHFGFGMQGRGAAGDDSVRAEVRVGGRVGGSARGTFGALQDEIQDEGWGWAGVLVRAAVGCVRVVEGAVAERVGDRGAMWTLVGVVGVCLWGLMRRGYVEESILALRSIGLQTSTSSPSIFSSPTTRFIPTSQIQDIFIYEAFIGFTVRFYLAVIVEGEEEAVVVFPKLLPRREVLEEVWRGVRRVLWGAGDKWRKNAKMAMTEDAGPPEDVKVK